MAIFTWRVYDTVVGDHFEVDSSTRPTDRAGNAIDDNRTVILCDSKLCAPVHRIEATFKQESKPFKTIDKTTFETVGEVIYPGTDVWTPSLARAIVCASSGMVELCDHIGGGKAEQFRFKYTGEDCSATSHTQDPNKVSCSGDPAFASKVRIVVNADTPWDATGAGTVTHFDGTVLLNGLFTAGTVGSDVKNETWVHILAFEPATGILTLTGNASNNETVTIDSKTYTFQDTLTDTDGNVKIGANASDTIDNLIAAIVLGAGSGTAYAASMTLHPTVDAAAGAGDTMDLTAKSSGDSGNSLTTTETMTNGSFGGATLSGGSDGTNETVLQSVEFHTSCSQPLFESDQFGSIIVEGILANGIDFLSGSSAGMYACRLFDLTNGNVIAEIPTGGGLIALGLVEEIKRTTVFLNLPAAEAILEIQVRKDLVAAADGKIFHMTLEE